MELFIIIAIIVIISIFVGIYSFRSRELIKLFKKGNVIVFGKKGKGKDLLFQYVINKRKKPYYANLSYGGDYRFIKLKDIECDNSFNNLISENINISTKNEEMENCDIYLSDTGIYLPSQKDTTLHKEHGSMPLFYAIQRHLYNSNFHCNCQDLSRIWKSLREQADSYVKCKGVIKLPFILIVKYTMFDKLSSAENDMRQWKKPLLERKEERAIRKQYENTNGLIKNGFVIIPKLSIKYDTRAFHKKIFGKEA